MRPSPAFRRFARYFQPRAFLRHVSVADMVAAALARLSAEEQSQLLRFLDAALWQRHSREDLRELWDGGDAGWELGDPDAFFHDVRTMLAESDAVRPPTLLQEA